MPKIPPVLQRKRIPHPHLWGKVNPKNLRPGRRIILITKDKSRSFLGVVVRGKKVMVTHATSAKPGVRFLPFTRKRKPSTLKLDPNRYIMTNAPSMQRRKTDRK